MSEDPFFIGTEVVRVKYYDGNLTIKGVAYVAKRYANGNVRLKWKHNHKELSSQYNVRRSGGEWELWEAGHRFYPERFKIATEELLLRAKKDAMKRRCIWVAGYLSHTIGKRKANLTPSQLSRINAILNEDYTDD